MISVWLPLLLPGCFASQNAAATSEYARQVTTANLRVAQLENELAESQARIEQLEEVIRAQGQSQATRLENLDQVNQEVTRLRGQIEVLQFDLSELSEGYTQYQIQTERRLLHGEKRMRQVESMLGVQPPPPPTDAELGVGEGVVSPTPVPEGEQPPPDPDDPEPEDTVPDDAAGKLELAVQRIDEGKPAVARAILMRAQKEHAGAPEIPEITYRLASTYFSESDYRKAALSYKRVLDDHPKSPWASWAMLKQGECFEGLGQSDNARLFFDGVIQRYPKSDAAKEAKGKLNR